MFPLVLTALALANPTTEDVPIIDVSEYVNDIAVLDDGEGHVIAYRRSAPRETVWYGDAHDLYALQVNSSSASGDERWSVKAVDYRSEDRTTSVAYRDGDFTMACAGTTQSLSPLSEQASQRVAQRATFHEHRWRRTVVGAWRDEWGVYYFIDRATGEDDALDHRVYIGWTGQTLRAPLQLIASDSLGRVYSAGNGTRRLVITQGEARYIEGGDQRELHALDLYRDGPFLHTGLAVYGDTPHGTPCDVLLPEQ